jgi:hypothetical protein
VLVKSSIYQINIIVEVSTVKIYMVIMIIKLTSNQVILKT